MRRLLLLVLVFYPLVLEAESAEERGLAIAIEADYRDTGWGDLQSTMRMILHNRHGEQSIRLIRTRTLEVEGEGDKSLTIFDRPADVKGTVFLSFTHATEPDDQWLYLPALKRVKRISSANKSGPFVGSEFAYEDIASQEVEKYTYKYLRDEVVDGQTAFVIERYPKYKHSGYTRQQAWIDHDHYRVLKVDYYDRKDALLKTLSFSGYRRYQNQYWRADEMLMENHQTGRTTQLTWEDYRFNTGLTDRDFDRNALQRVQ